MKRVLTSVILALSALGSSQIHAQTATFDVLIGLTSKCEVNQTDGAATMTDMSFTYTSFQTTDATASTAFNVRCTNTLPYTLALDLTAVTDAATNLDYTLALSATTGTGNGADQAFTVDGTIASGQAGTCATGFCDNSAGAGKTRTLTVAY